MGVPRAWFTRKDALDKAAICPYICSYYVQNRFPTYCCKQNIIINSRGWSLERRLLFSDDSLVFTKASVDSCKALKAIFNRYAAASGQLFNFDKSSMVFSGKIPADRVNAIKRIFQLNMVSRHEKYLGLPSMVGSNKKNFFNEVKLKVVSKISNWQHKFFFEWR